MRELQLTLIRTYDCFYRFISIGNRHRAIVVKRPISVGDQGGFKSLGLGKRDLIRHLHLALV